MQAAIRKLTNAPTDKANDKSTAAFSGSQFVEAVKASKLSNITNER
jgi:hypothetical protein